ncbi:MAG: aromatic amino acid DMT transporter YddG [Planctomycetota bacterium]
MPESPRVRRSPGTALGLLALLFWASTVGFSRIATESVGPITAGAVVFLAAGTISCAWSARASTLRAIFRHPPRYLLGCGALFAFYTLALYLAIGLAEDRRVTVEAALVNYLWPAAVLLFSVPILGARAKPALILGAAAAFAGIALAATDVHGLTARGLLERVRSNAPAYAGGLAAAVSWGIYSNLTRRWGDPSAPGAVPLFLLATGLFLGAVRLLRPERSHWTPAAILAVLHLSVFPTVLSCVFWEISMRTGNFVAVGAASHATPLLSTLATCAVLGARPGPLLYAGALLVAAGAVVCRISLEEPPGAAPGSAAG